MGQPVSRIIAPLTITCAAATGALAQCEPEWSTVGSGSDLSILALATHDEDGPGTRRPYLFVGGGDAAVFADVPLRMVSRWDGWRSLPLGDWEIKNGNGVYELHSVPQSVGDIPAGLYAGGNFDKIGGKSAANLARWDGEAWHEVGGGLSGPVAVFVFACCVFDEDGDGPSPSYLYVGGQFGSAGGIAADGLARWDGQTWGQVGGGLSTGNPKTEPDIYSLTVYDDGRGPALYVGGSFRYAGGVSTQNMARWDGQQWETLGVGPNASVRALSVFDEDGDGPSRPVLFAAGAFSHADVKPAARIARWDGTAWSAVGGWDDSGGSLRLAIAQAPDDKRETLYMGGYFSTLPDGTSVKAIARWDGSVWREVDYGVSGFGSGTHVLAMAPFDADDTGPLPTGVYAGGYFWYAGSEGMEAHYIARWGCPLPPRCDADLDRSGDLDLFDFLTFVNLFNAADAAADCDESFSFDLFDFLCFTNAFNEGC